MQSRIVLVSDDSDFFEYIRPKLSLRRSDELFSFKFDELPDKVHYLLTSVIIINSENAEEKTLELLKIFKDTPCVVFAYNENEDFKLKAYKNGMLAYITLMSPEEEIQAKLVPALTYSATLDKKEQYRELLVKGNVLTQNNDVFINYNEILDRELEKINLTSNPAVLMAISPNEKSKFMLQANQIETTILGNIRKNDILMSYSPNKYFLLLYNTNLDMAEKIWLKIQNKIPEKIYAGFANAVGKSRGQIVNEVLNRLHEAINCDKVSTIGDSASEIGYTGGNFKLFRQEFNKKIENTVTPVFYQIQQKYNERLFGINLEQAAGDGFSKLIIKSRNAVGTLKITSPGYSKINIDITYQDNLNQINTKRISLEPNELETGLLEDLLEQFVSEFKKESENVNN